MPRNDFELGLSVEGLKAEQPTGPQRDRVLAALLLSRGRRSLKVPALAVITSALLLLLPFLANRGVGIAWADVLRKTRQAANVHITELNAEGQVIGEMWFSGPMSATWRKDDTGRIVEEDRTDDAHFYLYLYDKDLTAPNATQYGTLWNITPQERAGTRKYIGGPPHTVESILNSGRAKLISQEKIESGGRTLERFKILMYGEEMRTVDAAPDTGRVLFIHLKGGETDKFDYPETIDPRVFSYKSRLTRNLPVVDVRGREGRKNAARPMPSPIAIKDGIKLRSMSVNTYGDLYVYWTGYLPDKRAAKRLKVLGTKTGRVHWLGLDVISTRKVDGHSVPVIGHPGLVVYRVELPEKIGSRLSIRIPTPRSYVEFKNVLVRRPKLLRD